MSPHANGCFFFILSTDNCLYQNSHRLFYKAFLRKHEIWFASVWKRENFIKYFSQLLKSLWTNFCFISLNTIWITTNFHFFFLQILYYSRRCFSFIDGHLKVVYKSTLSSCSKNTNILFWSTLRFFSFRFSFHCLLALLFLHSVAFDIINKMNGTVFYFDGHVHFVFSFSFL